MTKYKLKCNLLCLIKILIFFLSLINGIHQIENPTTHLNEVKSFVNPFNNAALSEESDNESSLNFCNDFEEPISKFDLTSFTDSFYLQWNSPHKNCFNYELLIQSTNYETHAFIDGKKNLEFEVTNLKPCVVYEINLNAVNYANKTVASKFISRKTEFTDPGPVKSINVTVSPNFIVTVSWDAPNVFPTCVKFYTIKLENLNCAKIECLPKKYKVSNNTQYELSISDVCSQYKLFVYTNDITTNDDNFVMLNTSNLSYVLGPVMDLSVSFKNSTSITIVWSPPIENPSCIKNYIVYWLNNSVETEETKISFDFLEPCEIYTASVCPISLKNIVGPCKNINIEMDGAIPTEVRNITTKFTLESLQIHWDIPETAPVCVKSYRITIWSNSTSIYDYKTEDTFINLPDMVACLTHTIQIIPVTSSHEDGQSSKLEFDTPTVLPIPPLNPHLKSKSSSSLTLSSTYTDQMNQCILNMGKFVCRQLSNNQTFEGKILLYHGQRNFTTVISNLTAFMSYSCSAQVHNDVGWSQNSDSDIFTTEEDLPGEPESVEARAFSHTTIEIKWIRPKYINGILINFRIYIYPIGPNFQIPSICDINNLENSTLIANATDIQIMYENGLPDHDYFIQIAAENGAGLGQYSDPIKVTTLPFQPSRVNNFRLVSIIGPELSQIYNVIVTIEWTIPCQLNGRILFYEGYFIGSRKDDHHKIYWKMLVDPSENKETFIHKETDFKPEYNYTVSITTIIENYTGSHVQSFLNFESPAGIPISTDLLNWGNVDPIKNPTENVIVKISNKVLFSKMGEIKFIALLLSERACQNDPILTNGLIDSTNDWPKTLSWEDIKDTECIPQYQTTEIRWMPEIIIEPKKTKESIEYMIGDQICTKNLTYCNGPLKPDTSYALILRVFTKKGYADSPIIHFLTDSQVAVFTIVITVIGLFFFAFLIGFVILWISRKTKRIENNQSPVTSDEPSDITVKEFPSYYATIIENNSDKINKEYNGIVEFSLEINLPFTASKLNENTIKNRYTNIYPYDCNRVLLNGKDDSSDYINASFINGYKQTKTYIATQGPKPNTCYDFWKMVFQCGVDKIVMLTQLKEMDKIKCHKYYPTANEEIKFDDITIKNIKETNLLIYHKRELNITQKNVSKVIVQYHFQKWPDHDCPRNASDLIKFVEVINEKKISTPIVVHCSAGVGRTGTYIAVDILLQRIRNEKLVNIYNTVKQLRHQRKLMVQTIEQYKFIYKCVSEKINENKSKKVRRKNYFLLSKEKEEKLPKIGPPIDIESVM